MWVSIYNSRRTKKEASVGPTLNLNIVIFITYWLLVAAQYNKEENVFTSCIQL